MLKLAHLKVYLQPTILRILLLGVASGLPLPIVMSTMTYWLSQYGLSKSLIGLFWLASWPYAVKFLWAPVFDAWQIPYLNKIGKRKSWILVIQCLLIPSIAALATLTPTQNPILIALIIILIAFLSASQDIVIDAYRIESLDSETQAVGAAATQLGYRIALLISGALLISLSDFLAWSVLFLGVASIMAVLTLLSLYILPSLSETQIKPTLSLPQQWRYYLVTPWLEFILRPQAYLLIIFILTYRLSDTLLAAMVNPFLIEMGFSGLEIGSIVKVYGSFATLVGTFVGAALCQRYGLYLLLWIGAFAVSVSNLGYWLLIYSPTLLTLSFSISLENFAGGLASAAFVVLLSLLCNREFTATQYALFSSLMALTRTFVAPLSGFSADTWGWEWLFIGSALLVLPALYCLYYLKDIIFALYQPSEIKTNDLHNSI